MTTLAAPYRTTFAHIEQFGDWMLPLAARFVFAATLLVYFLNSGLTKVGEGFGGLIHPTVGAYVQVFPKQFESVGHDASQLSYLHTLVVVAGTWAEFLLPVLIVVGLATRHAAVGMVGFVTVQSLTDIYGHAMTDPKSLGAWFDRFPDSVIMDQRLFWVFSLSFLAVKGAGALSLDAALKRRLPAP